MSVNWVLYQGLLYQAWHQKFLWSGFFLSFRIIEEPTHLNLVFMFFQVELCFVWWSGEISYERAQLVWDGKEWGARRREHIVRVRVKGLMEWNLKPFAWYLTELNQKEDHYMPTMVIERKYWFPCQDKSWWREDHPKADPHPKRSGHL